MPVLNAGFFSWAYSTMDSLKIFSVPLVVDRAAPPAPEILVIDGSKP